jgi:protein-disulfide isomerase
LNKFMLAMAATFALAAPALAQQAEDAAFTEKLRASLTAHPELVQQAMQAGQAQARDAQMRETKGKVDSARAELFARPAIGPVIGNPNGKVTVVEFLDYACPFCKQAHTGVDNIIARRKDLRVVIAQRPIFGPDSEKLARFALAADLQGRFAAAHDALYDKFGDDHRTKPTDEALKEVAAKAGLDYARLAKDMNGTKVSEVLARDVKFADRLGVSGTPFFVTSDNFYPGAAPENVMEQAFH